MGRKASYYILFVFWRLGLERYGQQLIRYVCDTDFADTKCIRYDTHAHDLRFQTQYFLFQRFRLIYTVNPANTSAKAK